MIPLLTAVAHAACPSPSTALDDAFSGLETLDLERVAARLEEVEQAWGCGPVATRDELARFWLATGVHRVYVAQLEEAGDALAAARRLDGALRVDAWGEDVRAAWSAAGAVSGAGSVQTASSIDRREVVYLDGEPGALPATLAPGYHVVQVVRFGTAVWADAFFLAPDVSLTLEVTRPPAAELPRLWSGTFAATVGTDLARGSARAIVSDGETWTQDATRFGVPVELGWQFATARVWVRPAAWIAPQIGTPYLYAGEEEPIRFPLAFGAGVEGGVVLGAGRAGALAQLGFPGQVRLRGVGAVPLPGGLEIEARLGANIVTEGPLEPAAGLGLVWLPAAR